MKKIILSFFTFFLLAFINVNAQTVPGQTGIISLGQANNLPDAANLGTVFRDGDGGSIDMLGAIYEVFFAKANNTPEGTVRYYNNIDRTIYDGHTGYLYPSYIATGQGTAPLKAVIETINNIVRFNFKSIYVFNDGLDDKKNKLRITGYKNGFSTGYVDVTIPNSGQYGLNITQSNGLTPSIFQDVDRVILELAPGSEENKFFYYINNISVGEPVNAAPAITSVSVPANGTYKAGETLSFTLNFSENVVVSTNGGTPVVPLTIGSKTVNASYMSGAGTSSLVFQYTIQAGDQDNDGIGIGSAIQLSGATIKNIFNSDASLGLNGVGPLSGVIVDATAPVLSGQATFNSISSIYGNPSASGTFEVSGTNLNGAVTVAVNSNFEISKDNTNFSRTLTVGAAGNLAATTLYIRTSALANAQIHNSSITLNSQGATQVQFNTPTITVVRATLKVSVHSVTKTYGAALPALTVDYSGFANGDTKASLTTLATASTTATAASGVVGSPYTITAAGAVSPNYTFAYTNGTLTVTPAILTVKAEDKGKTYGDAVPALTVDYSGFANGDTKASLTTQATASTTATAASDVAGSPYAITASGAVSPNYTFAYTNGALTVAPATLTVKAENKSKTYGAALPALTVDYSGFANGDTKASLTTQATVSTTATAASDVAGSPYAITASGAVSPNYTFAYTNGALTVAPATLTIKAENKSKTYGDAVPALTVDYSGFANGDTKASLTTQATASTTATAASDVAGSPYSITASGAVSPNYTFAYTNGALTVAPATLTVKAEDKGKTYGDAVPALTVDYSGFANGDTKASLTTQATASTTATAASDVAGSPYAITASGAVSPNYTFAYTNGALTVAPATLTVKAENKSKTYGAALPALTVDYSGFANGDTKASLTTQATASTTATVASGVAGSPYAITASGAVSPNYTFAYTNGALTVAPATLTVKAENKSKTYGAALPALTVDYSGFANGDTKASLTTQATASTTATAASDVAGSPYSITASGAVSPNYTFAYTNGALTVTPVALTVKAADKSKAYGAVLPELTVGYNGFVNGDTKESLTTQATASTTATAASGVAGSPYTITASGAVSPNYTFAYTNGALTVAPATLTVKAEDKGKTYGAAVPALTADYSGFVNGDTKASLTTQATLSTTATAASDVAGSPYSITASGAVSPNYTFAYTNGALTVAPATLTIKAENKSKTYGDAVPALTVDYSGFANGDTKASLTTQATASTTATAASGVAGSPYAITASGAVSPNYTFAYTNGTLTVTQAELTVKAADKSKAYGAVLPELTVGYNGFVNGDTKESLTTQATASTTATAASGVAGSPYAITASGAVSPNYTFAYTNGALTVAPATLTVKAENKSKTYGAALPALTVDYSGFANGDTKASLTTQATASTTATVASGVAGSPYAITASGAVSPNYTFAYTNGALTVAPATLTVKAENKSKTYGAALPALTVDYSGFANGDTKASLTTQATASTTATAASDVAGSPYSITASGAVSPNYTFAYTNGALTVTPVALTVKAENKSKAYGAALPELTVNYNGFVNGDTKTSLATQATLSTTATAASGVAGSPYQITAAGAVSPNYTFAYTDGTLIVTPVALTVKAENKSKTYGAALPALTVDYSGFANGDTKASLTTQATLSTTATAASDVAGSPYTITASGAASPNYTFAYTNGALTVAPVALTITADNKEKFAGTANPVLTARYDGFIDGESKTVLTTEPTINTTAVLTSPIGDYPITASGAAAANYAISYVPGNLKVKPGAPTSITLAAITLYENRPAGTSAGTLSSASDDPTATFTYSLVSGAGAADNNLFTIDRTTIKTTASLDYETKAIYKVRVRSTTQHNQFLEKELSISIADVNEIPALAAIDAQTICYNTTVQTVALRGISAGPETTQTTKLSVKTSNPALFESLAITGSGSTGTLRYRIKDGAIAGTAIVAVTVTDDGGTANGGIDTYSRTFVITVNALPVVAINSDKGIKVSKGEIVQLTATGGTSYVWSSAEGILAGQNSAVLTVRPRETTTYTVTATNASGCTQTERFTLTILDDLAKIKATNILTPNGDGVNDYWIVDNIDFYPNNEVKVFDKSGRFIYGKKGYDNTWDGTLNGIPLTEGTYYYVIDFGTNRKIVKGFITIIR